jgi:hypothetical protein
MSRITAVDPDSSGMSQDEFANLSDDEIMNMQVPPAFNTSGEELDDTDEDDAETATLSTDDEEDDGSSVLNEGDDPDEDPEDTPEEEEEDTDTEADPDATGSEPFDDESASEEPKAKAEKPIKKKPAEDSEDKAKDDSDTGAVDYKAAYEKIFSPFKANGKEIKIQSPEEAVELMQMGANYTKKLQALKPHLKMVKMLENQGLLDEQKLSYLIDLSKGNSDAVQKLVKDSGIDPMEIDTEKDTGYKPGNYQVSDEEMNFKSVLEDVSSDPTGKEVIRHINKSWDKQSKEALWQQPELLKVLTTQKSNGLFDQISSELDRRQMLGQMVDIPYIQAYYAVGQEMDKNGQLSGNAQNAPQVDNAQPAPAQNLPLKTRKVVKKKPDDSARVRAASPMKAQSKTVKEEFNPLSLSDEEFEKRANLGTQF